MKELTKKTAYIIFFLNMIMYSQNKTIHLLWDKDNDEPVQYATIQTDEEYSISNENGVFEINKTRGNIIIQNVAFQKLEIDYDFLVKNDTIYMTPNIFELDEVTVVNENKYNRMLKTILTDYALDPHQEKFYLRAIVRKNGDLYKIVDFSGYVEKKTLFSTSSKPMPQKNYLVQIENIRKVGKENKSVDFEMLSFEYFLNHISSIYLSPEYYNLSHQTTENKDFSKILFSPKDTTLTFGKAHYILNDDNTFNEVEIEFNNHNATYQKNGNINFRTTFLYTKTNFGRNPITNKIQLSKALHKAKTEVNDNGVNDEFDVTYIFHSEPIISRDLRNNVNLKKDIFELNGKYNKQYWESNDILPLTTEMQKFINEVNTSGKGSDFKTETNIK